MHMQRPPPGAFLFTSQPVSFSLHPLPRGFSIPALLLKNSQIPSLACVLHRGFLLSREVQDWALWIYFSLSFPGSMQRGLLLNRGAQKRGSLNGAEQCGSLSTAKHRAASAGLAGRAGLPWTLPAGFLLLSWSLEGYQGKYHREWGLGAVLPRLATSKLYTCSPTKGSRMQGLCSRAFHSDGSRAGWVEERCCHSGHWRWLWAAIFWQLGHLQWQHSWLCLPGEHWQANKHILHSSWHLCKGLPTLMYSVLYIFKAEFGIMASLLFLVHWWTQLIYPTIQSRCRLIWAHWTCLTWTTNSC